MTAKMFNPANQLSVVGLPQCPRKYRDHKPIGKFHLRVLSRTLHYNLGLLSFHQPSSVKNEKKNQLFVGVEGGYERKNKIHVESLSSQTINTPCLF